ncbi:hypothetical protein D9M68_380530 [compost metagenome]
MAVGNSDRSSRLLTTASTPALRMLMTSPRFSGVVSTTTFTRGNLMRMEFSITRPSGPFLPGI